MKRFMMTFALAAMTFASASYADEAERHGDRKVWQARETAQAAQRVAYLARGQNPRYAQAASAAARDCRNLAQELRYRGSWGEQRAYRACANSVDDVEYLFRNFGNRIHDYRLVRASRDLFQEARQLDRIMGHERGGRGGRGGEGRGGRGGRGGHH